MARWRCASGSRRRTGYEASPRHHRRPGADGRGRAGRRRHRRHRHSRASSARPPACVKNANSNALNGHAFDRDTRPLLGREVRVRERRQLLRAQRGGGRRRGRASASCSASSSAPAAAAASWWTGAVLEGRTGSPASGATIRCPGPALEELPGPRCWCGQHGCLETMLAGPGLARDCDGTDARDASGYPSPRRGRRRARPGGAGAPRRPARARARGQIVNLLDPDAIVLGGGLSNMAHLYARCPTCCRGTCSATAARHPCCATCTATPAGVRGAAWLWPASG